MFHVPALRLSPRRRWQRAPQEGWHRLCSCFLGSCCAGSHGGAALAPSSHPRRAPQQRWEGSTPVLFIAELRSPTAGAEAAASPCLVPAVTWGHPLCLRWGMGCSEGGGVGYGVAVALSRAPPRVQVAGGVPVGMNPSSWLSHSWVGPVAPYSSQVISMCFGVDLLLPGHSDAFGPWVQTLSERIKWSFSLFLFPNVLPSRRGEMQLPFPLT